MKWNAARRICQDKWLLFEAIEAYSEEGKRIVEELSVINVYEQGKEALKEYSKIHKRDKSREVYVYHTKNEELIIGDINCIGVRTSS
ncbi:hypothetical protein [Clostridium algidicarnis]|uniref:hypothetical protein n=1 Tax=Clostridium algidicarnis TaxID=37659 RepID=UPI001C0D0289|nr:hypothetical protein [Clostridium algidicarnis]MBU3204396.1 hypothetical protein [Clostridium algidicarnis]MBU3212520.1 hypothetical protein [Clostridium algidicarnis]MBU3222951.1 hypothetical protein [Clostridium algidicarnis]